MFSCCFDLHQCAEILCQTCSLSYMGNNNYSINNCYKYGGLCCGRGQAYAIITKESNAFLGPVGLIGAFSPVAIGKFSTSPVHCYNGH